MHPACDGFSGGKRGDPFLAEGSPPPTESYRARQAEYLDYCFQGNAPGKGGLYGQICRMARGGEVDLEPIRKAAEKVARREDTSDFSVAAFVRMLYLDRETHSLPLNVRALIEESVVNFKYWLDEPGEDKMAYWSENHQALFHSSELLAGQLWPDRIFPNAGMTGRDHLRHAESRMERWLDFRGRFGFSEWHSNVYFNEDIPPLVNLVDFAENDRIRVKAAIVLDLLAFDLLNNMYAGLFATVHGRTYPEHLLDGQRDSTREAAWVMLGLGRYESPGNFSGAFLSTSGSYWTPEVIEEVASATRERHEHRQRDGINVADGPRWGISYEEPDDITFWAGMVALIAPPVATGAVNMISDFNLWNGFLFGDLPEEMRGLLRTLASSGKLYDFAKGLEPLSRGIALESMSTYTYRTPDYQLSGAQDYNPGFWGAQTHMWQATLDDSAYVFTTAPSKLAGLGIDQTFAGDWIGSWMPRGTFYRNVGVIQYRRDANERVDSWVTSEYTHAYFPRNRFDEVRQFGSWTVGRKGNGYVALYSQQPTSWTGKNDYELIAPSPSNVWIVEMGSAGEWGGFDEFCGVISKAQVNIGDLVQYESPSAGPVEVGLTGPMRVKSSPVDIGPYDRWDNLFARQPFGETQTTIAIEGRRLVLDFEKPSRKLVARSR